MAQLERPKRTSESPKTPKSQTSPTFEQLLRVDEAYWSTSSSPVFRANHDQECLSPTNNKKSVITKVKERAKKLKFTLSGRKRHGNDYNGGTPPWGVTLDDYDDADDDNELDDDPEYLGAPMYESEAAPEGLKETARQHPRAVPVVSEKHMVPNRTLTKHAEVDKPFTSPNMTSMTEAMSEKLAPAYACMSDATHRVASKIASLTITAPETEPIETAKINDVQSRHETKNMLSSENLKHCSPKKSDKGVSVKEYFMNKLEPGEDEKALSHAITEAISPRKSNTGDSGVVEKVKGAVTSFFWHEEPASSIISNNNAAKLSSNVLNSTQQKNAHSSKVPYTPNSSLVIPLSSNAHQVLVEENTGKILQTN